MVKVHIHVSLCIYIYTPLLHSKQCYKVKVPEKGASSIAFILKEEVNIILKNVERLWNLADISMLRDSSGRDFLLCNSKLKTKVGIQFNVTAKKCFVSTIFTRN